MIKGILSLFEDEKKMVEIDLDRGIIFCLWFNCLFDTYFLTRKNKMISKPINYIPVEILKVFNKKNLRIQQAFEQQLNIYFLITKLYICCLITGFWVLDGFDHTWNFSNKLIFYWPSSWDRDIPHVALVSSLLVNLYNIAVLPVAIYDTFEGPESYGFNQETIRSFINNTLLQSKSVLLFVPLISGLITKIIKSGNDYNLVFMFLACFCVLILELAIYKNFFHIVQCVQSITPLPLGPLKDGIFELSKKVDFPLEGIFLADSKPPLISFRCFNWIVISESLIRTHRNNEIEAIVLNEIVSWKSNTCLKNIMLIFVFMSIVTISHFKLIPEITSYYFNYSYNISYFGSIMIFLMYFKVLIYLINIQSHHNLFKGDECVVNLGYYKALKGVLVKFYKDVYPINDQLYSILHEPYPSLLHRIHEIEKKQKSIQNKHIGKFQLIKRPIQFELK